MFPAAAELPALGTDRLVLRALAPSDAPALFTIFGDSAVCRYWSRPALPDLHAAAELQAEIARHFWSRWSSSAERARRTVRSREAATELYVAPDHRIHY